MIRSKQGLFSLEDKRVRRALIAPCCCMKGNFRTDKVRSFSEVHRKKASANDPMLQKGKFQLDVKKKKSQ